MKENTVFEKEYSRLNEAQKKAVDTIDGALMVVAGPGTGKTQIIGLRTANILLKTGISPENTLITTFTEAGVIAIKDRLVKFMGTEGYKVSVCTIHSFADDVIHTFPEKFSYEKTEKAIDDIDMLEILKHLLQEGINSRDIEELRAVGDDLFYLFDIKSHISSLKQEGISPGKLSPLIDEQEKTNEAKLEELQYNKRIKDLEKRIAKDKLQYEKEIKKARELCLIYTRYNTYLRTNALYDFNDMINFVLEKFRADEDLRYYYAEKFQYIMLDEYQDTNNPQNEIISLILSLAEKENGANIMVVGDDDQSIYRFQGANIENMFDFMTHFPKLQFAVLDTNYRSNQKILDTATLLIENNSERLVNKTPNLQKKLISGKKFSEPRKPVFFHAASSDMEKAFVLKNIQSLLSKGIPKNEIAVIVRGNREVTEWSTFLEENSIPVESKGKSNILTSKYVNFILDYLLLIENPYADERKLIDLLLSDVIDVENIDVIFLTKYLSSKNYVRKDKLRFFTILSRIEEYEDIEIKSKEKIVAFVSQLVLLRQKLAENTFVLFFNEFMTSSGLLDFIDKKGSFDDLQDVFTLFQKVKLFSESNKNLSLESFLTKINLHKIYNYTISRQIVKKTALGVQVMTAHGSKGLEFEAVFMPGAYSGNWDNKRGASKIKLPSGLAGEGMQKEEKAEKKEKDAEEERRLFFVALTRAKSFLFFSTPKEIGNKPKQKTIFLEEISPLLDTLEDEEISEEYIRTILINSMSSPSLHTFSKNEIEYIEQFLLTYKLSPTELNTFLDDPKTFLHNMILKYPFAPNEATIFGSVYHRVLELFFAEYLKTGIWKEKAYLTGTFKLLIEKEILTDAEKERLLKKGIEGLTGWYETYKNDFGTPLFLEYNFRQRNIYFGDIPLTGKIDKIVKLADFEPIFNQKLPIALVDYKTGKPKTLGVVKGIDRNGEKKLGVNEGGYFRQLMFYRLLAELDSELARNYEVTELVLDFVEGKNGEYTRISIPYTEEEYEEFKSLLKESREKIKDIEYWKEVLA